VTSRGAAPIAPGSTASLRLAPTLGAPATARRFVRQQLRDSTLDGLGELTELLASELIGNVVLHARSPMTVRISHHGSTVRVEIDDDSTDAPVLAQTDPFADRGRGLMLLNALASDWGTRYRDNGKTVWFELDTSALKSEVRAPTRVVTRRSSGSRRRPQSRTRTDASVVLPAR
jgi:anti-sigma regulatory factor (Ser/Thr protein kinase)